MAGVFAVTTLVHAGCDYIPERPPLLPPKEVNAAKVQAEAQEKLIEPPSVGFAGDWDAWYGYFLNHQQVGYSHISAKRVSDDSSSSSDAMVVYQVEEQLRFRRGRSISVQHLDQESIETRNGELRSFESAVKVGPLVTRFRGTVANGQLNVEMIQGSERKSQPTAWESYDRGLVGVEQSLRRTPMKTGERRTLKMLFPHRYRLGTIELVCTGQSAVAMLDGSYNALTEIVSTESLDGNAMSEQVLWTDDQGVIQKQLRSESGMVAFRMDRSGALKNAVDEKDIFDKTIVKVHGAIDRPAQAKQVAYIVKPNAKVIDAGKSISFPPTPGQFVREMDDGSYRVLVDQEGGFQRPGFVATRLQPTDEDLESNAFIDSNHGDIRKYATTAIRGDISQQEIALSLARNTKDLMTPKSTSNPIGRASVIYQEATGGSTQYAVLLAALLRAKGIPSRLAIGVKYVPGEAAMAYHVWTIAYVDDKQWIPLDPMTGSLAAADRIAFVTSNLSGTNHYKAIAAVLGMMSQVDIEIKAAAY